MREQSVLLELGQLVPDRRRPAVELDVGGQRSRRHRLAGLQVAVDDLGEDQLLPGGQHDFFRPAFDKALILGAACADTSSD